MENKREKVEHIYTFKCKKCKKILGGVKKDGYIKFFYNTCEYALDGNSVSVSCGCKEKNTYNLIIVRKKIFDKNLKSVLESSAKNQEEKNKKTKN